ncbi:PQQ-dependent sugar dehydrogenase [Pseudomonas taiwanensis]|uniref:PQQ-dependent sugar dehydrogenase n=1 Tax=Pseudomonas taiwanensis TaxID=470150 RepID=A0ABR6V3U4_9PSED|nr:PQQ-dependent sugar dehydrogenase [Pseudomonas taiwanensis]
MAPSRLVIYEEHLFEEWHNNIFVATLKDKSVRRIIRKNGLVMKEERLLAELGERFRDIKVGQDGAIYVLTDGENAKLLRMVPATIK